MKNLTKKNSEDTKKVVFDKNNLKDVEADIENINDTPRVHPNESYEEFMEHENFE